MIMNDIPVLFSPAFDNCDGISHGFFGRGGGVSEGRYKSLNTGWGSDDKRAHIFENRRRVANALGCETNNLLSAHQHHSIDVITATNIWDMGESPKADAIVTNIAGIACSALAADCAPVLFADPVARVIGAAHAGWRGALGGVTDATIDAMLALGATRENIHAAIGPCIGAKHFEVGPEFVAQFVAERTDTAKLFTKGQGDRSYFDIKTYLARKLLRAGVRITQALPDCTYAQHDHYFSYRHNAHNGISDYGRNISAIILDES